MAIKLKKKLRMGVKFNINLCQNFIKFIWIKKQINYFYIKVFYVVINIVFILHIGISLRK